MCTCHVYMYTHTLTSYSEATCNISDDCIPTIEPTIALDSV